MFTPSELVAIATMADSELLVLDLIEKRVPGVTVSDAQAVVAGIRAKAKREIERIEKAASVETARKPEKKS